MTRQINTFLLYLATVLAFPLHATSKKQASLLLVDGNSIRTHTSQFSSIIKKPPLDFQYIKEGKCNTIKKILENGSIDPNLPMATPEKSPPLCYATRENRYKIVKLFLNDKEVDRNQTDDGGRTALYIACMKGYFNIVTLLVENPKKCIELNQSNNFGESPLGIACHNNHYKIVKYLLKQKNIQPNLQGKDDLTALHITCYKGNVKMAKLLFTNDQIDPNLVDRKGNTAMDIVGKKIKELTTKNKEWRELNTLLKLLKKNGGKYNRNQLGKRN